MLIAIAFASATIPIYERVSTRAVPPAKILARGLCRLQDDFENDDDATQELIEEHGNMPDSVWEGIQRKLEEP